MNKSKLTIALIATMALGVPVANANEENAGSFVRTAASSLPDTSVDFTKAAKHYQLRSQHKEFCDSEDEPTFGFFQ